MYSLSKGYLLVIEKKINIESITSVPEKLTVFGIFLMISTILITEKR